MKATWLRLLTAKQCEPPHGITHPDKHAELCESFRRHGWGVGFPPLVGYELPPSHKRKIQLLSGSHRWAAARDAGIKMPVVVRPFREASKARGNIDAWLRLLSMGAVNEAAKR